MTEPLLEVDDLTIQYRTSGEPITAVSNASFTVGESEYFGLVGESGCGKSTVAETIIGALDDNGEVVSGEIRYKGEPIQDFTEEDFNRKLRWKEISFIPQSSMSSLDPLQRVEDQAREIARVHGYDTEEAIERFEELFEIMGIPRERISDYPHQFSGGMEQRTIIALSLFLEPSIIIADEPTTALDVIMQDQIFRHLELVQEELDTSMVLITHDISLVFESCDRMAIMHGGQVAETGPSQQLYDSPRHPYSILLQQSFPDPRFPDRELEEIQGYPPENYGPIEACTFVDRCPWADEQCRAGQPPLEPAGAEDNTLVSCVRTDAVQESLEREQFIEEGVNEATEVRRTDASVSNVTTEPVLELKGLEKHFYQSGGLVDTILRKDGTPIPAVDGVDLTLGTNEVKGVIGESGCGKTTLLKTLAGLHDRTGGELRFRGEEVAGFDKSDWKQFRRNVQIIFQDPFDSLNPKMDVNTILREPLRIHDIGDRDRRVKEILEKVELNPPERYLDKRPYQLSGGEKQRVSIARALILEPEVVLADEPVSMLDVSTQASILKLLSNLITEFDLSMIYISHDLSTVSYICDEVNVMYLGRIVESAPTKQLLEAPKHPYSEALVDAIPLPDPSNHRERTDLEGSTPEPGAIGNGCRFKDRCPQRMDVCENTPAFVPNDDGEGHVACHLYYDHSEVTAAETEVEPSTSD
jgi:peptide/nickel transport system ATP-binding protein